MNRDPSDKTSPNSTASHERGFTVPLWVRWTIAAGLMIGIGFYVDFGATLKHLSHAHPGWLIAAGGWAVVQLICGSARWAWFARQAEIRIGFGDTVRTLWTASFWNQVFPTTLTGDGYRVFRLQPHRGWRAATLAVIQDRVSIHFAWIVLLPLGLLSYSPKHAGIVALALVASALWVARILRRRPNLWAQGIATLLGRRGLVPLLWSQALNVSLFAQIYCCALALGLTPSPILMAQGFPWVLAALALPFSVGSWGIREGALVLLYAPHEGQAAQWLAISLAVGASTLVAMVPGLFWGALEFLTVGSRKSETRVGKRYA